MLVDEIEYGFVGDLSLCHMSLGAVPLLQMRGGE